MINEEIAAPAHRAVKPAEMGGAALAAVCVTLATFAAWYPEDPESRTPAAIRAWAEANGGALTLYAVMGAVAATALIALAVMVRRVIGGVAGDVALGAGIAVAVTQLVAAGGAAYVPIAVESGLGDGELVVAYQFIAAGDAVQIAGWVPRIAMLVAVAIGIMRTRVVGAWLAWLTLAIAVFTAAALAVAPLFYLGVFGWVLWPLAVAVALAVGARRQRSAR